MLYFTAGVGFLSSLRKVWCKLGNVDFLGRTVSSTRSVDKPLHTYKGCVVLLIHGIQMPLYPAARSARIAIIVCLDESGRSWYHSFIPLLTKHLQIVTKVDFTLVDEFNINYNPNHVSGTTTDTCTQLPGSGALAQAYTMSSMTKFEIGFAVILSTDFFFVDSPDCIS